MSSPKPVEPSLWRSLLIVKTLHRIAEELHREASYANEAAVEDKSVESAFDDNQLEALFCLQNAPVAVYLSEDERTATDDPKEQVSDSGRDLDMEVDETNEEPSSLIMLSTYLPSNSGPGRTRIRSRWIQRLTKKLRKVWPKPLQDFLGSTTTLQILTAPVLSLFRVAIFPISACPSIASFF